MSPQPEKPVWGIVPRIIGIGNDEPGEESQSGCVAPSKLDRDQTVHYKYICQYLIPNQGTFKRYIQELCSGSNTNLITERSIKRRLTNESYKKIFDDLVRGLKS